MIDYYLLMTNKPIYIILGITFTIIGILCISTALKSKKKRPLGDIAFVLLAIMCFVLAGKNALMCKMVEQKQASDFANVMVTRCISFTYDGDKYYLDTQDKDGNFVTAVLDNSLNVIVKDMNNGYIDNRNKIIYLNEKRMVDAIDKKELVSLSKDTVFP